MTASIHPIRQDAKPDPLAYLLAERDKVAAELDRFGVVDRRQAEAVRKVAEIDAAIAALDGEDKAAVTRWAESAEGEPPPLRLAERKALLARRLDVEAEGQAAQVAVDATQPRRLKLIHDLNAVGAKIRRHQVSLAVEEARRLHAEGVKRAAEARDRLMRVMALQQTLIELNGAAVNRNDHAGQEAFAEAQQALSAFPPVEMLADRQTVDGFAAEWRGRLQ